MSDSKKAKILVVDDEENILKAVSYILDKEGYSVETAADGDEALRMVNKFGPDLVLLDIMMPKKNGFEVCGAIKENKKTQFIQVVILTALKQKEERIKGIEAGADDFLSKPLDQRELFTRIKSLLRIKFLSDELKESYKKLQDLEEYKANLTGMIVHDMKNILMSSETYLNILSGDTSRFSEMQKEYIETARVNNKDLLSIILNLLDISMIEEGKLKINYEKTDLGEIINRSIKTQKVLAKQNGRIIRMEMNLPREAVLYADKGLVERVTVNLVNNAIKYSNGNNEIVVRAGQDAGANCVEVRVESSGRYIPPEHHKKIFEKFSRSEALGANHKFSKGLGLTFCKMVIEAHNGKIWLESGLNGHNKFCFTLPIGQYPKKLVKL
jgi:two-component system, sensor histidine kinase and response regulator